LQAFAELLIVDHHLFGSTANCPEASIKMRHFIGMTLTNLTYQDAAAKKTLCLFPHMLRVMNAQIAMPNEDVRQVYASVLRNLSWKADGESKAALRESNAIITLMRSAMSCALAREATLKALLSAVWNLSSHCTANKCDICALPGALEFLVRTLAYVSPTRRQDVVENGGGILRTVSSEIARNDAYRQIMRDNHCAHLLLRHLRSTSLTIVSNACGTLWNLSARNAEDQRLLWQLGAVPMLKRLVNSRHKLIATGSAAALKNLLPNRPADLGLTWPTGTGGGDDDEGPLYARKLKALEKEINAQFLADLCTGEDNGYSMATNTGVWTVSAVIYVYS
jgi:adenomatosis polyposis coli protein